MRFSDGIAIISLGGSAVMDWQPATAAAAAAASAPADGDWPWRQPIQNMTAVAPPLQLLLHGGDVLLLHGDARYAWSHGIAAVRQEVVLCAQCAHAAQRCSSAGGCLRLQPVPSGSGCVRCMHVERRTRVSITLRALSPEQRELTHCA